MFNSTYYTILGGVSKPSKLIERLVELEYKVALICDEELFGTLEIHSAAKKAGLKPIFAKKAVVEDVNYILLAKNANGFSYLMNPPACLEDLEAMEDVVIIFDFDNTDAELMKKHLKYLKNKEVFKGVRKVKTFSDKEKMATIAQLDIPAVPVEISKYLNEGDHRLLTAVKAIESKDLYENLSVQGEDEELYVKPKSYWMEEFSEETKNLGKIIASCVDDYKFGNPVPPHYKFVSEVCKDLGLDELGEDELFAHLSKVGLEKRLLKVPAEKHEEYRARLQFEIDVINKMKFPGYMLIVWDFVKAAKDMGIPVGPGRGSAAGSLVAFALEITNLDPIPYGLLFERFLNPERVSMPDIDMDFCQTRRPEILQYMVEKYGKDNVAQIITFGQLGGKSGIRDAGRILSHPLAETDKLAKLIPDAPGTNMDAAYKQNGVAIDEMLSNSHIRRVWDFAKNLEGVKRNLGVHAAGLVVCDEPIVKRCPIYTLGDTQVVQYEGKYLEDVNLIKFDFLGLKTLSVIESTVQMLKVKGIDLNIDDISLNDKATYDLISTGNTYGIFQIESDGMQSLCKRLQPDTFEDLIAILALYRPGPMESGMLEDFIQRKRGEQKVSYFFDDMTEALEPILKPTYGVIVYQEQVMQIVQSVGGFSLGEADIIRRAMGKKQIEYMNQKKDEFSDRAAAKGFKKEEAAELFGLIEKFAGYGFNKSHSAAYAKVTYITAYLKKHYPVEFMASLMNFDQDNLDKLTLMVDEVKKLGIELRLPSIIESTMDFSVSGDSIIYGLRGIKGVGSDVELLLNNRDENAFVDVIDFIKRTRFGSKKLNKRILTGLVFSGALDSLATRAWWKNNLEKITAVSFKEKNLADLSGFFAEDLPLSEKIENEQEFLGFHISNPFERVQNSLNKYEVFGVKDCVFGINKIVGWIKSAAVLTSKKGKKYGRLVILDSNGNSVNVVCFESKLSLLEGDKKPSVIFLKMQDDNSFILEDIRDIKDTPKYFRRKTEEVAAVIKEEVKTIEIGDYKSLAALTGDSFKISKDGQVMFSFE